MRKLVRCVVASALALGACLAADAADAQTLQWLGATNGDRRDGANVSADGSTVAFQDGSNNARRWTAATGSQPLGTQGRPRGVSATGEAVVGAATGVYSFGHAWRWTVGGGLTVLPVSPSVPTPGGSYATGISAFGRISGGASTPLDAPAFWEPSGPQTYIGPAASNFQTTSISPDGTVIVGAQLGGPCGQQCAMRWDETGGGWTGPTPIGTNPGPGIGIALAASNGGAVILGVNSTSDDQGWAWSQATGIQLLDKGGQTDAVGFGVSGDGSLIVGYVTSGNPVAAAWAGVGAPARTLAQILLDDHGFSLGSDVLQFATDVSLDGRVIVGKGLPGGVGSQQVFRLELPAVASVPALGLPGWLVAAAGLLLAGAAAARARRPDAGPSR